MKNFFPIIFIISFSLFLPGLSLAQDVLGQQAKFNIESAYDLTKRNEVTATLIRISLRLYCYADNNWWNGLVEKEQEEINQSLNILTEEFEEKIYPTLTGIFGTEWTPGVDKDTRITILLHPMKKEAGGYTSTADGYPKAQAPRSNEREMIYLNSQHIKIQQAKVFLSHELVHLITFNQKDKTFGVSEDVWLNEARAEYVSTLLGYDREYEGSNLQQRVKDFLDRPFDSLTEWRETSADYGVVNLFTQYLVDHYGTSILSESLKMKKTGAESINAVLSQKGFKTDFAQIFNNWAVAVLLNDCQIFEKYCYLNQSLNNFRVTPLINYLPFIGESTLSVNNTTKDWAGNWYKFIGGQGNLRLEFQGETGKRIKILYIIQDSENNLSVKNLTLGQNNKGELLIPDFGSKNISLTIIPISQNKISNFLEIEPSHSFFWSASIKEIKKQAEEVKRIPEQPKIEIERERKIAELKAQIMEVQLKVLELLKQLIKLLHQQITLKNPTP